MNILMVLSDNTFPPDIRVKKETRALIEAGHKIFLIARRGPNQTKKEIVNGVYVYRISSLYHNIPMIGSFLYRYCMFFRIITIFMSKKRNLDVLHVHDLPFALATCLAGKIIRKPIVFDMHEDYVEMLFWGTKEKKRLKKIKGSLKSKILEIEEKIWLFGNSREIDLRD